MILCTGAGWAAQHFGGLANGLALGLLGGLIAARFVPKPASCPLPGRGDGTAAD